jgi:ABC-2 type transport system ATP-binding protein
MLVVDRLSKSFGSVAAVSDVSFSIQRGATFGLLGPNGAGKTTTMRMILGIMIPDGGTITWEGATIGERTRLRFGYLPEERGLYGKMGVRDHIIYFGRLHGMSHGEVSARADEWIARLELSQYAQRPCAELSKGNQQKVQVACAAVHRPELLILDEPFSGLDPVNAEILLSLLEDLRTNGTTLVLSSHEMWQLERLCTNFCIIAQGRTQVSGTLAELRANWPVTRVRISPNGQQVRAIVDTIASAKVHSSDDGALVVDLPPNSDLVALLRRLVADASVVGFEPIEPSLRDVYLRAMGEGEMKT